LNIANNQINDSIIKFNIQQFKVEGTTLIDIVAIINAECISLAGREQIDFKVILNTKNQYLISDRFLERQANARFMPFTILLDSVGNYINHITLTQFEEVNQSNLPPTISSIIDFTNNDALYHWAFCYNGKKDIHLLNEQL